MNKKLVSVVIPVYNVKKYLAKCIDSVLSQTYSYLQIIIVDDGSTDGSSEICDSYLEDRRVEVYHIKNHGVSYARNLGIDNAKGRYITFIDPDDYVDIHHIKNMMNAISENVQLVVTNYYICDYRTKKRKPNNHLSRKRLLSKSEALDDIYNPDDYLGYSWNKLFDLNIINSFKIRFKKNILVWEDLLFCCQYMDKINNVIYIPNHSYYYNKRDNSASSKQRIRDPRTIYTMAMAQHYILKIAQKYTGKFKYQTLNTYAGILFDLKYLVKDSSKYDSSKIFLKDFKSYIDYLSIKKKIFYLIFSIFPFSAKWARKLFYSN